MGNVQVLLFSWSPSAFITCAVFSPCTQKEVGEFQTNGSFHEVMLCIGLVPWALITQGQSSSDVAITWLFITSLTPFCTASLHLAASIGSATSSKKTYNEINCTYHRLTVMNKSQTPTVSHQCYNETTLNK